MKSVASFLFLLLSAEALLRSQVAMKERLLTDVRRLGAALRGSSPAAAAAAYKRLRSSNRGAADALHQGARGFGVVLMPVPVMAVPLDDAMEDVGEDLQAITQNFGSLNQGVFDEGFFAQPMSFAVHGPEFEPFDTFGALRNVTGWSHSAEFHSVNGSSFQRVCENGNCTEFRKICQGGTCTETARPVQQPDHAAIAPAAVAALSARPTTDLWAEEQRHQRDLHRHFDRLFDHSLFDDSLDWPDMRVPMLRAPVRLSQRNDTAGTMSTSRSYSESTETRMENGVMYKKVCRNGKCTEETKKCADWNCMQSM